MIQVIERALSILEFVARYGKEPVQLIKIAENIGLRQPTTANIVKTLVQKNYLEHLSRKEGYRLGIAAYQLTGNASYDQDLVAAARGPMEMLTGLLNETSLLGVLRNNKRCALHIVNCDQMLQVRTVMIAGVYDTSTGRLLMANLAPKELDALIKAIGLPSKATWPGADTREGLEKALKEIKANKFVQTVSVYHTIGFAVPIFKNKDVIASLSVFVPESRYTPAHKQKIIKQINVAAKEISGQLKRL